MSNIPLDDALQAYEAAVSALDSATVIVQGALTALRAKAGKSTFVVDDQYYQIRERKKKLYLCKLDGPPQGRPRKGGGFYSPAKFGDTDEPGAPETTGAPVVQETETPEEVDSGN